MRTKIKWTLCLLLFAFSARASEDSLKNSKSDTTRFKVGKLKITVVEDASNKKDSAYKELFDSKNEGEKKGDVFFRKYKSVGHWAGFELGFTGLLNADGNFAMPKGYEYLEVNPSRVASSVNLNIAEFNFSIYKHYLSVVTGLGFEWNNYYFKKAYTLEPDIDSVSAIYTGLNYSVNKLVVNFINVPLYLEFNSKKVHKGSWHLAVGVVGGYMYRSHSKQVYEVNGKSYKDKAFDDFNTNPFRLSASVRVGFGRINIFANYALTDMFQKGKGPVIHPYSIGLTIISL